MLVLSRKVGQRVIVSFNGETVAIELMQISGSRVRIGVDAAAQVTVHREEIWDRLMAERSESHSLVGSKDRATITTGQAAPVA